MDEPSSLKTLAEHLASAFAPLEDAVADPDSFRGFMLQLGWEAQSLPGGFAALAHRVTDLIAAVEALTDDPEPDQVKKALSALDGLRSDIDEMSEAPLGTDLDTLRAELWERLTELLIVDYLSFWLPAVHRTLSMIGVIDLENYVESPTRPGFLRRRLRFEAIAELLSDPMSLAARAYEWGGAEFRFPHFASDIVDVFIGLGVPASLVSIGEPLKMSGYFEDPDDAARAAFLAAIPVFRRVIGGKPVEVALVMRELPDVGDLVPGFIIEPHIPPEVGDSFTITPELTLDVHAESNLASTFGILVRPESITIRYPGAPGTEPAKTDFEVTLTYAPKEPSLLLGRPSATRLEVSGMVTRLEVHTRGDDGELVLSLDIKGLALILAAGDQDGFWGKLLGAADARVPIPLGLRWSSRTGLGFAGGAGFLVRSGENFDLGPIRVHALEVELRGEASSGRPPALHARASAGVQVTLGPVQMGAAGFGLGLDVVFKDGNMGPFEVDLSLRTPTSITVSIDAGPVSGGGGLEFNPEKGRYTGFFSLSMFKIAIGVFGMLETRLPDGRDGYSFVLIAAAEFTPIQLGYGFTLNGIGGYVAINRTANVDALQAGLRDGSLNAILFPTDPVKNAVAIVNALEAMLPAAEGRYLFGPAAIIGWGTPPVVTMRIAVLLEVPDPIRLIVIASIHMAFPADGSAIAELNMDALGTVEFAGKRAALDARLRDSKISGLPLSGDMALRIDWGDNPSFLFSIGGFHPRFQPPPGFPALQRLRLEISRTPQISLEAYLALTSNTAQIGAHVELSLSEAGFDVRGTLGFDALFQFDPFHFETEIAGSLTVKWQGVNLLGVSVDVLLEGPSPWHIKGSASIEILFFSVSLHFEHTFGDATHQPPLEAPNVGALLADALSDARNWSGRVPAAEDALVTVREPEAQDRVVVAHPLGRLSVRQRVVPLGIAVSRYGPAPLAHPETFSINSLQLDNADLNMEPVQEPFAMAQYLPMRDEEKLARPSFEPVRAGAQMIEAAPLLKLELGVMASDIEYEDVVIDVAHTPVESLPAKPLEPSIAVHAEREGAAGRAAARRTGARRYRTVGRGVKFEPPEIAIATVNDLTTKDAPDLTGVDTTSYTAVAQALASHVAQKPEVRGQFQVVGRHEIAKEVA